MRLGVTAAVVDGRLVPGDVEVDGPSVVAVGVDGGGIGIALPGFIDIHTHGYDGVDFAYASPDEMRAASLALTATGVTGFQPTLLTLTENELREALQCHAAAEYKGATYLGTHLEGPFLSPEYPGAHDPELLRDPDLDLCSRLIASGQVGQMTLAPELPGAFELIDLLAEAGSAVAVGHSDADAAFAHRAFDSGARILTHVFNASRPFSHRDPGVGGVALTRPDVFISAVVDNVHLSEEATLLAMGVGPERFLVVTDAMSGAGRGDGTFRLGNREVTVHEGEARLADGTIASSVLTMDEALRNLVELGWDLPRASVALASTPARAIGRPEMGSIKVGSRADIVVVDDQLRVLRTFVSGEESYRR
ncbi:N-acetylglucosamine-6-phosphate deacetylase [soil metagenome]